MKFLLHHLSCGAVTHLEDIHKFTNYFSFRKIFAMKTTIFENFEKTPHIGHLGALNPHEYWAEDSDLFLREVT